MYGRNPIRGLEPGDGTRLWIQEVFYTLQGEGPFTGQPAVFVRTAGCNLRCVWCDTDFESSNWYPDLMELLGRIEELRPACCDLVVISGGEPMRQNIVPLAEHLIGQGLRVQIETNGTLWQDLPDSPRLCVVCSPKTPKLDSRLVSRINAFKYIITSGETDTADGLPTASTQPCGGPARLFRPPPGRPVYIVPCDDPDPARSSANRRACIDVALVHGHCLNLQMHKILGIA